MNAWNCASVQTYTNRDSTSIICIVVNNNSYVCLPCGIYVFLYVCLSGSTCVASHLHTYASYFRDADDAVIRPMPRIKRLLSEAISLPHIVQVSHFLIHPRCLLASTLVLVI